MPIILWEGMHHCIENDRKICNHKSMALLSHLMGSSYVTLVLKRRKPRMNLLEIHLSLRKYKSLIYKVMWISGG